nr:unnamed protein product [Digitaria exilis]
MELTTSTVVLLCAATLFATTYARGADGDQLVAKTCANIMGHGWERRFTENFCKSTLQHDKRSTAAKHPRDLAIIAIDLAQRAVTDMDAKIDGVLRSGPAGNHIDNLQYCRLDYATVASTIPVCRATVINYKPDGDQLQLAPNDYFEYKLV